GFQITFPCSPLIMFCGSGAIKPLWAFSKSVLSANGNFLYRALFACRVVAVASCGCTSANAESDSDVNTPASARCLAIRVNFIEWPRRLIAPPGYLRLADNFNANSLTTILIRILSHHSPIWDWLFMGS